MFNVNNPYIVKKYIDLFDKIRKDSGLQFAIKYFKASKLHCTRYICGRPLFTNQAGVAIDSTGWPKRLDFLKKFLTSEIGLRVILTLLTFTRSVKPNKREQSKITPDYSTITNVYKGKEWTIPANFIKFWISRHNLKLSKPIYTDKNHYTSTKGSPNGPATVSALWGACYLNSKQLQWILGMVNRDFWKSILSLRFISYVNNIVSPIKLKPNKHYTGKLSIVKDPELKMRIIAMVDYQSQFVLKPIHEGLLKLLSSIPNDRTYTQDPFHDWSDNVNGEHFHSLDLSAATDRFPIKLQKKLLSYIYDDAYFANNWANLLANREFYSSELNSTLRYSVGQPMGAYSSWAAFTITHHLVVHYAAFLCGILDFNDYIILGDDIVIRNDKVAVKYVAIMTRLGVDISTPKTHVSKDTYEFAKRWIKNGKEITGIPLRGILNNWNNPKVVYLEIFEYFNKYALCRFTALEFACLLYNNLPYKKNRNYSYYKMKKLLYDFNQAIRYTFGLSTLDELRSYFAHKFKNSEIVVPGDKWILLYIKELIAMTLVKEIALARLDMAYNWRSFSAYFYKLMWGINEKEFSIDRANLQAIPLYSSYSNHILRMKKVFKLFESEKVDLMTICINVQMDNFDMISYMHRSKSKYIEIISKLWTKAFNIMGHKRPDQFIKWHKELATLKKVEYLVSSTNPIKPLI